MKTQQELIDSSFDELVYPGNDAAAERLLRATAVALDATYAALAAPAKDKYGFPKLEKVACIERLYVDSFDLIGRPVCPACKAPLAIVRLLYGRDKFQVHCGNGPCPGLASNNGATGQTVEEAIVKLTKAIEAEII